MTMKRISLIAAAAIVAAASAQAAPFFPKGNVKAETSVISKSKIGLKTVDKSKKQAPGMKKVVRRTPTMTLPAPASDLNIITEAPAGQSAYYAKEGESWESYYGYPVNMTSDGYVAQIVYTDDNKIYMSPAFSAGVGEYGITYLVGDVKDNVATFSFPQLVGQENYYNEDEELEIIPVYAIMMEYYEDEDGYWDLVPSKEQTVSFNIAEDGTLTPVVENPDSFIAGAWYFGPDREEFEYTYGGWYWNAYADCYTSLTPIVETPMALPEGVTVEEYNLIAGDNGYQCGVGISGSDVYITGICAAMPESVWAGKMEDGKVVFPSVQYMGINKDYMCSVYAMSTVYTTYFDPDYGQMEGMVADGKEIIFDYDADASKFTSESTVSFSMTSDECVAVANAIEKPVLVKSSGKEITEIAKPTIVEYEPYDDDYGFGYIDFTISNITNETDIIPADKLYFSIYLDGELFEFDPELYNCFTEPTSLVKFGYIDESDSYAIDYLEFTRTQSVGFEFEGFSTIGVQAVYKDGDKEIRSEITTIDAEEPFYGEDEAISEITSGGATATAYYDLQGRRVSAPRAGQLLIKLTSAGASKVRF